MSSSTLLLPPRDRRTTPHLVPKGRLEAPDEALIAIRQLYLPLYQYLCETSGRTPSPSQSISMPRFKVLDDGQFLELMTDVSDGQSLASKCSIAVVSCCTGHQKCGDATRKSRAYLHVNLF